MAKQIRKMQFSDMERPRPLTTREVELKYGIPVGTLRYWRHCNIGPRSYSVGRSVRYDRADVEEWLETQKLASARGGVA